MTSFLLTPKVSQQANYQNKISLNITKLSTTNEIDSNIFTQLTPKVSRRVRFTEDFDNEKSFENRLGMLSEEADQYRINNKHAMRKVNQLAESLSATKKISEDYRAHIDLLAKENQILKLKLETNPPADDNVENSLQSEEINLQNQIDTINKEIIKLNQQISSKKSPKKKKSTNATESLSIEEDAEAISRLSQLEDEKIAALKLLETKKTERSHRIQSQKNKISELSRRLEGYQAEKNSLISLLNNDQSPVIDIDENDDVSSKSHMDNKLRQKADEVDIIMSEIHSIQQETVTSIELNADIQYIKSRLDNFQSELLSVTSKHKKKKSNVNVLNESESETLSEAFLLLKERNEENQKLAERLAMENLKFATRLEAELKKNLIEETNSTILQLENQLKTTTSEEESIKTQINENKQEIANLKLILESLKSDDIADAMTQKEEENRLNSILATHEINKLKAEEQLELIKKENLEKMKYRKRQTGELLITLQEYESDKDRLLQAISNEKGYNKEKSRTRIAKQKSIKYQNLKQEQEISEIVTTLQNYEIQQLDEDFSYKSEYQLIKDRLDAAKEELKILSTIKDRTSSISNSNNTTGSTPGSGVKRTISRVRGPSEVDLDLLKRQPSMERSTPQNNSNTASNNNEDILQLLNRDSSDPSLQLVTTPSATNNRLNISGTNSASFYKRNISSDKNSDVMNVIYESDHIHNNSNNDKNYQQWQEEREILRRELQHTKKELERLSLVLESSVNRHIKEADKLSDLLAEWTAQSQSWAMELIIMHEKSNRDHAMKSTSPIRTSKNTTSRRSQSPKNSNYTKERKSSVDSDAVGPIYDNKALQMRVQYLEVAVRRWEKEHIRWDMQKKYFENKLKLSVAELSEMTSAFRRSQLELEMLRCSSNNGAITTTATTTSITLDITPNKAHPDSSQLTPISNINGSFSSQFINQINRESSSISDMYNPRWNDEQSPIVLREVLKSICAQFQSVIQSQTIIETEKRMAEEKLAVLLNQLGMISRQQQQSDLDLHTLKTGMTRFAKRTADLAVCRSTELQQQLITEELIDLGAALDAGIEIPKSSPKIAVTRPRSSAPTGYGFRNRRGGNDASSPAPGTSDSRSASPRSAQNQPNAVDPIPAVVRRQRPKSSSATPSILFNRSVDSSRGMDLDLDVDIDIDVDDQHRPNDESGTGSQRAVSRGGSTGISNRSQTTNGGNSRNSYISKETNYNTELIEEDKEDDDNENDTIEINRKITNSQSTIKSPDASNSKEIRPVFKPSRPRPRSSTGYKSTSDKRSGSQSKMSATAGDVSVRETKTKGRPSSGNFYFRPSSGTNTNNNSNNIIKE